MLVTGYVIVAGHVLASAVLVTGYVIVAGHVLASAVPVTLDVVPARLVLASTVAVTFGVFLFLGLYPLALLRHASTPFLWATFL